MERVGRKLRRWCPLAMAKASRKFHRSFSHTGTRVLRLTLRRFGTPISRYRSLPFPGTNLRSRQFLILSLTAFKGHITSVTNPFLAKNLRIFLFEFQKMKVPLLSRRTNVTVAREIGPPLGDRACLFAR